MMVLAPNEAGVASRREIAIAYRGLDEVAKHWYTRDWMRAQVRYKLRAAREIEQKREGGGRGRWSAPPRPGLPRRSEIAGDADESRPGPAATG